MMDQGHDGGMGDWNPNAFAGAWGEQQFDDAALSFNPHPPQEHGYHHNPTPDGFNSAPPEHMSHHLPPSHSQPDLYNPPYQYYPDEAWTGAPSTTVYGQPAPHGSHGYYHDQPQHQQQQQQQHRQQHPASNVHQTVDSRFALADASHGHDFQPRMPASHGQGTDSFGFDNNMAHSQTPAANSYIQEAIPQWQQVAAPQYTQSQELGNPMAASRALNPVAPPARNQSPNLQAGRGVLNPPQQQFVAVDGEKHPHQSRPSVMQSQPFALTGSPQSMPQPVAPKTMVSPPASQPHAARAASVQGAPTHQTLPRQSQVVQQKPAVAQALPTTGDEPVQGANRQAPQAPPFQQSLPRTPSVAPVPAQTAPLSALPNSQPANGHPQPSKPPAATFTIDTELLEEARKRDGALQPGIPYMEIGDTAVKLRKGPPTKRYVILAAKGGKPPLFPESPRGWTLAESLGNHQEGYKKAESADAANPPGGNVERFRADERLRLELDVSENEIPADWWKKMQAKPAPLPKDKELVEQIQLEEKLRLFEALPTNKVVGKNAFDAYLAALSNVIESMRQSYSKMTVDELKSEWKTLSEPLETILLRGLDKFDAETFRLRLGKDLKRLAKLCNILVQTQKIGDVNSVLLKAILQLFTHFTNLTPNQLRQLKFNSIATKIKAGLDPEVQDLVATIVANARKNKDLDPPSPPSEMAGSGNKADDKVGGKVAKPPSKAVGGKRNRDEDGSEDSRLGKKQATGAPVKAVPGTAKVLAPAAKAPAVPPAPSPNPTAGPAKKPPMLLPGKRAPQRPAPKAEPPKAEAVPKPPVKSELAKPQPPKATGSQPTASGIKAAKIKVSDAPQPSRFAALLSEIDEPKKVKVADPLPAAARTDPNETEEQRKRRLRKEERRKLNLRVAFKGDDRLVEIREFSRHPEEIAESGMMRDIRSENKDKMEEGAALKKRKSEPKELDEWENEVLAVDFDVLPAKKRAETFVNRGGLVEFETEQQKFMQDREARELMVVYTDLADIPATPRSPQYEPSPYVPDEAHQLSDSLETEEIRQRARDREGLGFRRAVEFAQTRLAEHSKPGYAEYKKALQSVGSIAGLYNGAPAQVPTAQDLDVLPDAPPIADPAAQERKDQQVLEILNSDRVRNWKDPDPYDPLRPKTQRRYDYGDPKVQMDINAIEDLVARIKSGAAFQNGVPGADMQSRTPATTTPSLAITQAAPAAPPLAQTAPDYSAAWAQYHAQQQQQQQQQQQHVLPTWASQPQHTYGPAAYSQAANPYGQAAGQPGQADANSQISSVLAALQNPNNAGQQQSSAAANDPNLQAILAAMARSQPAVQQPAPLSSQSNEYVMSLLKAAGQAPNNPGPAASTYPHDQGHQFGARQDNNPYGQGAQGNIGFDQPKRGGGYNNHGDRDRDRGERERDGNQRDGDRREGESRRERRYKNKSGGGQSDVPDHLRGINRNLIGTKPCVFFARGQCAKGDKCTFRHE